MPLLAPSHAAPLPLPALGDLLAESQAADHAAPEAATAVSALATLATPATATELAPASTLATLPHAPSLGATDLTPAPLLADSHAATDLPSALPDALEAAATLPLTWLPATPATVLPLDLASVLALAPYPATAIAERVPIDNLSVNTV